MASTDYVDWGAMKASLSLQGQTYADDDIKLAITAASRVLDNATGRRFYPDADANQVRYYTATETGEIWVDDLVTLTSLETAPSTYGTYSDLWVNGTDYVPEPFNAPASSEPWTLLRSISSSSKRFPTTYPHSVKVTGKFGWTVPPAAIVLACQILATQYVRRVREAPFGIVAIGAEGQALRLGSNDAQLTQLITPYVNRVHGIA